jgi:hypothetical protein
MTRRHLREAAMHRDGRMGCPMCTIAPLAGPAAVFSAAFALGVSAAITEAAPAFCGKHRPMVDAQLAILGLAAAAVEVEVDPDPTERAPRPALVGHRGGLVDPSTPNPCAPPREDIGPASWRGDSWVGQPCPACGVALAAMKPTGMSLRCPKCGVMVRGRSDADEDTEPPPAPPWPLGEEDEAFLAWWGQHTEEWQAIGQEMIAAGQTPSAEDVTLEHYRRMNDRGESPFEARRKIDAFVRRRAEELPPAHKETP